MNVDPTFVLDVIKSVFEYPLLRIAIHSSVVLLVGLALALLLRRCASAAVRHLIIVAAQIVAIIIPLVWLVVPELPILPRILTAGDRFPASDRSRGSLPTVDIHADSSKMSRSTSRQLEPRDPNVVQPVARDAARFLQTDGIDTLKQRTSASEGAELANERNERSTTSDNRDKLAAIVVAFWMTVSILLLLRLIVGGVRLALLARTATLPASDNLQRLFSELHAKLTPRQRCRLVICEQPIVPMAWGIITPAILLPTKLNNAPTMLLRSILQHELAHLRRRDPLTYLIGQLSASIYWFNPLAWMSLHRASALAEQASDDRVLSAGIDPSDYAEHLMFVVRAFCGHRDVRLEWRWQGLHPWRNE